MTTNRSLGEQCHDAMLKHAEAQNTALRLDKMRRRKRAAIFNHAKASSAAAKEAIALTHPAYTEAEDEWLEAETAANLAKAESDGMRIRFEEYRTREATNRAEMNLR